MVLILGAGINGAAIARELVLNRVPVWVVDTGDLASGATAYSSRLIHGGLRYLEYGEFDLVRESLAERTRLLRLAPHLVRPLELFIPAATRWGGLVHFLRQALGRFVPTRSTSSAAPPERGLTLVRAGLAFYDAYAQDPTLPKHRVLRVGHPEGVRVDPAHYRWLAGYHDAQIVYPERLVVAMLQDAGRLAQAAGIDFKVFTYHQAKLAGRTVEISPINKVLGPVVAHGEPAAIVNATGAWVDDTLQRLGVDAPTLMGGTKGSHFFTFHAGLRDVLGGKALYAAAADGRPVFITPLSRTTLVGTTDEPFRERPESAVATERELEYLLSAVNHVLPQVQLTRTMSTSTTAACARCRTATPTRQPRSRGVTRSTGIETAVCRCSQ